MYCIRVQHGGVVAEALVENWQWYDEGHPVCERLYVRLPADQQAFVLLVRDSLRSEVTLELDTGDVHRHCLMPNAYVTTAEYIMIAGTGNCFLDFEFLYPLSSKRYNVRPSLIIRQLPRKAIRARQAVDWSRHGF